VYGQQARTQQPQTLQARGGARCVCCIAKCADLNEETTSCGGGALRRVAG